MITPAAKILWALLCVVVIGCLGAFIYVRNERLAVERDVAERAEITKRTNAEAREAAISRAEAHYKTMLEIENTGYTYALSVAKSRTERASIEAKHSSDLLRHQLDRDRSISEARKNYP